MPSCRRIWLPLATALLFPPGSGLGETLPGAATSGARAKGEDFALGADAKVGGEEFGEWTINFWRWLLPIPGPQSPARDTTGKYCPLGQSGPVWFLAGRMGAGTSNRRCTIPAGKHILFPIHGVVRFTPPGTFSECSERMRQVDQDAAPLPGMWASVDGVDVPVARSRVKARRCFALPPRAIESGSTDFWPSASDGYWVLLRPLPPGQHTISFGADNFSAGQPKEVHYMITVQ